MFEVRNTTVFVTSDAGAEQQLQQQPLFLCTAIDPATGQHLWKEPESVST
jgi:hypothetical protein